MEQYGGLLGRTLTFSKKQKQKKNPFKLFDVSKTKTKTKKRNWPFKWDGLTEENCSPAVEDAPSPGR